MLAGDYQDEWRTYRKKRTVLAAVVVLFLFATPLLLRIWWLLLLAFVAVGVASVSFGNWPCPRCGQPFLQPMDGWSNPFLRRCPHCGLPKWAVDDSDLPCH
jgi:hypothetical protein